MSQFTILQNIPPYTMLWVVWNAVCVTVHHTPKHSSVHHALGCLGCRLCHGSLYSKKIPHAPCFGLSGMLSVSRFTILENIPPYTMLWVCLECRVCHGSPYSKNVTVHHTPKHSSIHHALGCLQKIPPLWFVAVNRVLSQSFAYNYSSDLSNTQFTC